MFLVGVIDNIFKLLYLLILIRVIISWLRPSVRDRTVIRLLHLLYDVTEPILEPIRRIMPVGLGIDFSPWIALLLLDLIKRILINILI